MLQNNLQLNPSQKIITLILVIIVIGGIMFRLIFSHFELPLNSDNLQYFWYAIDHSLGETENSFRIHNNGWPMFVSIFFSAFNSENFLDFMALQKILSIIVSSLTAIPIYFLGKKFFSKELALLGSLLFVFEPRIVQNSTFGISDPLYILGLTIAIVFVVYSRKNLELLSFAILSLTIGIRSEGLFLIPAFIIVYLWQKKITKESIIKILISIIILVLILSAITFYKSFENESLFSRIDSGVVEIYSSPETNLAGGPLNLLIDGVLNFVKFLGWSQFPVWMFFVPIGFISLLIAKNQKTGIILTLLFFISLPTLYAFSFADDTRYLFPLYPIFSILALFFINKISTNQRKFVIIQICIVIGLISSSSIFLIWKDIDVEDEVSIFNLIKEISDKEKVVNHFGYETSYIIPVALEQTKKFPVTSNEIKNESMKVVSISRVNSFEEFMKKGIDSGLTHLVIKEKNQQIFLDDVFINENNYPFLSKEYDSVNSNYIPLKIFKINYELYNVDE